MNCTSARSKIELACDGALSFDAREALDQHLMSCVSCQRELESSLLLRVAASSWAADFSKASDPGLAMDQSVLARISNRAPGRNAILWRTKVALSIAFAAVLIGSVVIGSYAHITVNLPATDLPIGYLNVQQPVLTFNTGMLMDTINEISVMMWIKLPADYVIASLGLLVVINMFLYSVPKRQFERTS